MIPFPGYDRRPVSDLPHVHMLAAWRGTLPPLLGYDRRPGSDLA
jgi:hypothetical protein